MKSFRHIKAPDGAGFNVEYGNELEGWVVVGGYEPELDGETVLTIGAMTMSKLRIAINNLRHLFVEPTLEIANVHLSVGDLADRPSTIKINGITYLTLTPEITVTNVTSATPRVRQATQRPQR